MMKLGQDRHPFCRTRNALLAAAIRGDDAPPGYEARRSALWGSCLAYRTAPKRGELLGEIDQLLVILRRHAVPNGVPSRSLAACLEAARHLRIAYEVAISETE